MSSPELPREGLEPTLSIRFNGQHLGPDLQRDDRQRGRKRPSGAHPANLSELPPAPGPGRPRMDRLGGVVKPDGSRIANDLNEWAERTFIECGQNFHTLLDYCEEEGFLGTRHKGATLYLVARTG